MCGVVTNHMDGELDLAGVLRSRYGFLPRFPIAGSCVSDFCMLFTFHEVIRLI